MAKIQMSEVKPEVLRAAQQQLGYSDRDMATRLHLGTEKTWWRWRTSGQIPTTSLPAVAIVLELPDLLEAFTSRASNGHDRTDTTRLAEEVAAVRGQLGEILEHLRQREQAS